MQFQTPFAMGKKWRKRQMVELSSEKKSLKVYSGTGSYNCLNTSDYTSNHSNSWWNVCCNQPSLTGIALAQAKATSEAAHYPRTVSLVGLVRTQRCKQDNFLSRQNGIMMSTQARRMFCASTYQGILAPSSQCIIWLIEITFKGTVAWQNVALLSLQLLCPLNEDVMRLTLLCLFPPLKNESSILCRPTSIYKLKDYSSEDDAK